MSIKSGIKQLICVLLTTGGSQIETFWICATYKEVANAYVSSITQNLVMLARNCSKTMEINS